MKNEGFQVRHLHLGIYQGWFLSFVFWHSTSNVPELGIAEFGTRFEAEEFIRNHNLGDLAVVEPFDLALHLALTTKK